MNTLDTTLYNLRPRPSGPFFTGPPHWSSSTTTTGPPTPGGSQPWSPKLWQIIDKEMSLKECSVYCYSPEEDPYDGEEGAIWSFNYFFFNKARKRVCYTYLRGLSIISHSPMQRTPVSTKRCADGEWGREESGASKRARYWLGDRAVGEVTGGWGEDDDEVSETVLPDRAEEEHQFTLLEESGETKYVTSADEATSPYSGRSRSKSTMRGISEDIAESMEI